MAVADAVAGASKASPPPVPLERPDCVTAKALIYLCLASLWVGGAGVAAAALIDLATAGSAYGIAFPVFGALLLKVSTDAVLFGGLLAVLAFPDGHELLCAEAEFGDPGVACSRRIRLSVRGSTTQVTVPLPAPSRSGARGADPSPNDLIWVGGGGTNPRSCSVSSSHSTRGTDESVLALEVRIQAPTT